MRRGRPPIGTPQTLREGLWRLFFLVAGCGVFTAIGALMIRAGGAAAVVGVVGALFFGLGVVLGAVLLAGGGRKLRLDEAGLHVSTGFGRSEQVRWDAITWFSVRRTRSGSSVVYGLIGGPPARERRVRGFLGQFGLEIEKLPDGGLPTLYGGMNAKELAAYLNEWHRAVRTHEVH